MKRSLSAYFFSDSLDDVSRNLVWKNFVIPAMLLVLQDHVGSNPHRIRLNEYLFQELNIRVPEASVQEESVIGILAVMIDAGSVGDEVMEHSTNEQGKEDSNHLSVFNLEVEDHTLKQFAYDEKDYPEEEIDEYTSHKAFI